MEKDIRNEASEPNAEERVEISDDFEAADDGAREAAEATEAEAGQAVDGEDTLAKELEETKAQLEKEKKEYLFLAAEFDNFRKRTLREKSEIIKNGAEQVLKGLLPIVDDFERAIKASADTDDADTIKEGTQLIYNKLVKYLNQNGVKEIDPTDTTFDTERHEAIAMIPAPDEEHKGKILDTVEKGYMLNDKVLRHAKVVVGQ